MISWPRSLFGRLVALLAGVVVASQLALLLLVVNDRLTLLASNYAETQLPALERARRTLDAIRVPLPDAAYALLVAPTGLKLHRGIDAPDGAKRTVSIFYLRALDVWRQQLGADTDIRYQEAEKPWIWVKVVGDHDVVWLGMPAHAELAGFPWRVVAGAIIVALLVLAAAYGFAARLAAPIIDLQGAARAIARGEDAPSLKRNGPSELVELGDTLKRTADELRRIERERAVWLAGVSHDLRSPLTKLRIGIETPALPGTAQFETWYRRMNGQVEAIDHIVGQFIDYARLTQIGGVDSHCEPAVVIPPVVARWRGEGREITIRDRTTVSVDIAVDTVLLQRLMDNLIDNAFKYGATKVNIDLAGDAANIICRVQDNGPGIAEESLEQVREPFHRGDAARGGPPGTGLGLSIVERITRLGGGTMALENQADGGLQVTLKWPACAHVS